MNYKVLGISSGLGVSLFPFKENVVGNIEYRGLFHTAKNEQWELNFPKVPLYKKFSEKNIPEIKNNHKSGIDVIVSSPDCGSGSVFRYSRSKVLGDHTKNESLKLFFSSIESFKPKFFLFENLDGLFKSFPKQDFKEILSNYRLVIYNEPVSAWGNSQKNRKRLVIVGIRKDLPKKLRKIFKLPKISGITNCQELYGDLGELNPSICHVREDINSVISIHARKRMSLLEIQRTWKTRLKGKKRWETEPGFKFSTAPGVYRNLANDFPATARKANRQFDDMGLTLTPRQLARVQGVPDSFQLFYNDTKSQYWINKARCVVTKTPPMEISIWFKKKLTKAFKIMRDGNT